MRRINAIGKKKQCIERYNEYNEYKQDVVPVVFYGCFPSCGRNEPVLCPQPPSVSPSTDSEGGNPFNPDNLHPHQLGLIFRTKPVYSNNGCAAIKTCRLQLQFQFLLKGKSKTTGGFRALNSTFTYSYGPLGGPTGTQRINSTWALDPGITLIWLQGAVLYPLLPFSMGIRFRMS